MKKHICILLLLIFSGCAGVDRAPPAEIIPEETANSFVITRRGELHPNLASLRDVYVLWDYERQPGIARLLDNTADALIVSESEARQILELYAEQLQAELFIDG